MRPTPSLLCGAPAQISSARIQSYSVGAHGMRPFGAVRRLLVRTVEPHRGQRGWCQGAWHAPLIWNGVSRTRDLLSKDGVVGLRLGRVRRRPQGTSGMATTVDHPDMRGSWTAGAAHRLTVIRRELPRSTDAHPRLAA